MSSLCVAVTSPSCLPLTKKCIKALKPWLSSRNLKLRFQIIVAPPFPRRIDSQVQKRALLVVAVAQWPTPSRLPASNFEWLSYGQLQTTKENNTLMDTDSHEPIVPINASQSSIGQLNTFGKSIPFSKTTCPWANPFVQSSATSPAWNGTLLWDKANFYGVLKRSLNQSVTTALRIHLLLGAFRFAMSHYSYARRSSAGNAHLCFVWAPLG